MTDRDGAPGVLARYRIVAQETNPAGRVWLAELEGTRAGLFVDGTPFGFRGPVPATHLRLPDAPEQDLRVGDFVVVVREDRAGNGDPAP